MKIGIPRALLYYRYGRLWENYLRNLGAEVVLSPRTDESILSQGLMCVSSEVCLPIKIVAGHLVYLQDQVDAIFFPRLDWLYDGLYACPKMIGIVDIARMLLNERVRLIAPSIRGNFTRAHLRAGLLVNRNPVRVWQAWRRAVAAVGNHPAKKGTEQLPGQGRRVGLIGHFYNLEDEFIAGAIKKTFVQNGYQVVTKEQLPAGVLLNRNGFARNIRWVYERELYNAFEYLLGRVDGFCMVVSMGCGPDSLVAEFMRSRAQERAVPFLLLVIDEHTGTAGLVTRVEAFVELLRRQLPGSRVSRAGI
ncbi:MAG: acyl-CoA dehydratase activase-related protein [candidate division WOR-3 bacterium]|jgi:predicted nucleotide-binding protein (sugar kinase/HSP70/actin superfamily)